MKYMGSKNKIANDIIPIITKNLTEEKYYIELFCGGCNVIDKINHKNKIANDNNPFLIELFKGLLRGEERPNDINKQLYDEARNQYNTKIFKMSPFMIGWIGYMGSANGRFFDGGYSGISNTKTGKQRDYIGESIRNIEKQVSNLKDVIFTCFSYDEISIPNGSIIYCDPPYSDTKRYNNESFDSDKFWEHCRYLVNNGNEVYISEYNAPDDFVCIFDKNIGSSLSANGVCGGRKESKEKLFVHRTQLDELSMFDKLFN